MIDKETWKIGTHHDKNGRINPIQHACSIS